MKDKLLSIGGRNVKFGLDTEEELNRMLNDGILYNNSKRAYTTDGEPNQCHRNSADRNSKYKDKIVTGYALFNKTWYQHSWNINQFGYIYETTPINFKKYYGYTLTKAETIEFCYQNE